MSRLAILAFAGALPQALAARHPQALYVTFGADSGPAPAGMETAEASYEKWGALFETLKSAGVTDLVMAGGLGRPALNPANFDARTMQLVPVLMGALQQGDDALLRTIIGIFEGEGFTVKGAHEVLPGLTAEAGVLAGEAMTEADAADTARGRALLAVLGSEDVGQAAVFRGGLCLGIETVQGTDAMLGFVAQGIGQGAGQGGVLVKAPKPGQDLRVDMPAIGPATVDKAKAAGLNGIAIAAGGVIVLEREKTLAAAEAAGLFITAFDA